MSLHEIVNQFDPCVFRNFVNIKFVDCKPCCAVQVCAVRLAAKSEYDPNAVSKYVEIGMSAISVMLFQRVYISSWYFLKH